MQSSERRKFKRTIARRSNSAGLLYVGGLVLLLGAIIWSFDSVPKKYLIYVVIFGIIGIVAFILILRIYVRTPKYPIILNEDGNFVFSGKTVVPPHEVYDVGCSRARGGNIVYEWGTVYAETSKGRFGYGFIDDCENVVATMLEIIQNESGAHYGE